MSKVGRIAAGCRALLIALAWGICAGADTIYWGTNPPQFGAVYSMDAATGHTSTLITGTGTGPGGNNIDFPTALAVGPDGNIYVGNGDNGAVVQVTPAGAATNYYGNGMSGDTGGLAFDSAGNLYDAQIGFGLVGKITPTKAESTFASGLDHPQGGAFDPAGNYYVLTGETASGATVVKVTATGATSPFASGITGLFWDSQGDLYEGTGSGMLTVTPTSGGTTVIASGLTFPIPLNVDSEGNIYVWESSTKQQVDLISPGGQIATVASIGKAWDVIVTVPEPVSTLSFVGMAFVFVRRKRRAV